MMHFLNNLDIVLTQWKTLYAITDSVDCEAIGKLASRPVEILEATDGPYLRNIMKLFFEKEHLRVMSRAKRKPLVHAILVTIAMRNRLMLQPHLMNANYKEIIANYQSKYHPELFCNLEDEECVFLARHILVAKEMMKVIPPRQNQGLYLAVGGLMENSNVVYKTGGDPSRATRRRQDIFQTLTGILPSEKKRSNSIITPVTSPKRKKGKGKGKGKGKSSKKTYEESSDSDSEEEEEENVEDEESNGSTTTPYYSSQEERYMPPPSHYYLSLGNSSVSSSSQSLDTSVIEYKRQSKPAQVLHFSSSSSSSSYSSTSQQIAPAQQVQCAMEVIEEERDDEEYKFMKFGTNELLDVVESFPIILDTTTADLHTQAKGMLLAEESEVRPAGDIIEPRAVGASSASLLPSSSIRIAEPAPAADDDCQFGIRSNTTDLVNFFARAIPLPQLMSR
jgi:hypothetical protein